MITRDGFIKPTFQEIREQYLSIFREVFGADIDESEGSLIETLCNKLAIRDSNIFDIIQYSDSMKDPNQAEGAWLDMLAALTFAQRLPATRSRASCVFYGADGGQAGTGSIVASPLTEVAFSVESNTAINKENAIEGIIAVQDVLEETYTVTVDSVGYSYAAAGTEEPDDILNEIKDEIDAASIDVTATVENEQLFIRSADVRTPFEFSVTANLAIAEVGSPGEVVALETGALVAPSMSITRIDSQVDSTNWDSVVNFQAATIGRNAETDVEFRQRRLETVGAQGAGTDEAIAAALRVVPDVSYAFVVSNRGMTTDPDGRPPKSFEPIVEGGNPVDIANAIWQKMPAGIENYGLESPVTIEDSQGFTHDIYFTRPETKYLWIDLEIELYGEEVFPGTGTSQIRDQIVAWAATEYDVGKDVIFQRIAIPVYRVPGIGEIKIEVGISTDPDVEPAYAAENIPIANRERAEAAINRIRITTV